MACRENCSGNCVNNTTCFHVNGVCLRGCQNGYSGQHCNECKEKSSITNATLIRVVELVNIHEFEDLSNIFASNFFKYLAKGKINLRSKTS